MKSIETQIREARAKAEAFSSRYKKINDHAHDVICHRFEIPDNKVFEYQQKLNDLIGKMMSRKLELYGVVWGLKAEAVKNHGYENWNVHLI